MKAAVVVSVLFGAIACAKGATLAPGLYSLKNVGYKACDQESVYLGFNNKTCPIAPYSRPASIGTNSVWKSWDITITGYHSSGFPLAYLSTGMPEDKTMRCPGNLSPLEPGTCGKSAVTIDGAKSEWRLVGPVSGYENPTYKLVANMKKSGCARYLSASSSCEDSSLKMATSGDSSRTLWELTPLQLGTKAPGAASIVTATRGSGAERTIADVSFVAPADPGCGPILHYDVTAKPLKYPNLSGGGATITKEVSGSRTSTKIEGLTANVRYNFTIDATNACGVGPTTWYVETLATSDAYACPGQYSVLAVKADSKLAMIRTENSDAEMFIPTRWKSGNDIVQLVLNERFGAALARNGTLGVWGENISTDCNPSSTRENCVPEGYDVDVAFIHGYQDTFCITKKNGNAACIGYDDNEGDFKKLPGYTRFGSKFLDSAYDGYLTNAKFLKMGQEYGCVVYFNGNLRCWGTEYRFESDDAAVPLPISFYNDIIDVGITQRGICALKATGDLACSDEYVPDGDGDWATLPIPEDWDRGVAAIDCGERVCCAWKSNGDFTCWGDTTKFGVDDDRGDATIPNWVAGINKYTWRTFQADPGTSLRWPVVTDVVSFALAKNHACLIRKDGSLQCFGDYTQSNDRVGMDAIQVQLTLTGYDYLF